jgi:predicted secreted Zn-dependent protease
LSTNEGSFSTKVSCYFIKTKSWARIKNSDILLAHEQGHFDIAELFARKLRKAFAEYKFNHQTVSSDFNFLFNTNQSERDKVDALYDKETNLSQNRDQQLLWNKKIKIELDKLQKYASPLK